MILAVALMGLSVLGALGVLTLVDADAWRPQVIAAMRHATGRELRIGKLRLAVSLTPTLAATDVALANLPGGSQPDMLRVGHAEVKLSLLPLLAGRIEIARLVLLSPEILLERGEGGRPNWLLGEALTMAAPAPDVPAARASDPPATAPAPAVAVRELRIEGGVVRWRNEEGERRLDLHRLEASARGLESPVTITGQATYAGMNLALNAESGPLSRLVDRKAIAPWPLKGTLETPGARLTFAGTLLHPLEGSGYTMAVEGATVNLSVLDGLIGRDLPALRQVAFAARATDTGGPSPEITGIALRIGESDLASVLPGLRLTRAEFSAAALEEKLRGEAVGTLGGEAVRLTVALGPLAAMLPGGPRPTAVPVELAAEAAGATLAIRGNLPVPWSRTDIDLSVTGRIPDLGALSALAGLPLPALHPVTLDGRLVGRDGTPGLAIRGLAITAPEADLSGEVAFDLPARPLVQATLNARRVDLDAIRAALATAAAASAPPAEAPPTSSAPSGPPPPAAAPRRPAPPRVFSERPLPWASLGQADLDLRLTVGELRYAGAPWRDLNAHVSLQAGRLALDPLTATLAGGRGELRLALDSSANPPLASLFVHAPGVGLRPLLGLLGLPNDAAGTGDLDADLFGTGRSARAIAASLGGRLGLALTNGEIDNRLLSAILPTLMPDALPQIAGDVQALARPGRTRLRCLAVRGDAEAGVVNVPALAVDSGRFTVQGGGTVNLHDEALQMRLRPMLRGAIALVLPMRLGGTLAEPRLASEARGANVAGPVLGALAGNERGGDVCAPALAAVRAGTRPPTRPAGGGR